MNIAREEFDLMVEELIGGDKTEFDTMCGLAEKILRPLVKGWCSKDSRLQGRHYEDDIMQEIHLHLMKKVVNGFLVRDGIEEGFNNDPDGFQRWMVRVAHNLTRDFASKVQGGDTLSNKLKTEDTAYTICEFSEDDEKERIEKLKKAVAVVLEADACIYKVLTWFAQMIFVLEQDVSRKKSADMIVCEFENKTLYEMYDAVLSASKRIPWLSVTQEQKEKLLSSLSEKYNDDISYGDMKYKDFFMKQNGRISAKKSVSDWEYRMDTTIVRKFRKTTSKKRIRESNG